MSNELECVGGVIQLSNDGLKNFEAELSRTTRVPDRFMDYHQRYIGVRRQFI